jgi:hypothetical protein
MKKLFASLLMACSATLGHTTISDKLALGVGGLPIYGSLRISWPTFTTVQGQVHTAGSQIVPIAGDGTFSVSLEPTDTATPTFQYTVQYLLQSGQVGTTTNWTVPTSTSSVSLNQMARSLSSGAGTGVMLGQIKCSSCSPGDVPTFDGMRFRPVTVRAIFPGTFTTDAQNHFHLAGATHGQGVNVITAWRDTNGQSLTPSVTVDPVTGDVDATFSRATSGTFFIDGGSIAPNFQKGFTSQTWVAVYASEHHFATSNLAVAVYDQTGNLLQSGVQIQINPATYEVDLTFSQATTGKVVIMGAMGTATAIPPAMAWNNVVGVPTASGSQAGVLSASDWAAFNSKQAALGYTAENASGKGQQNGYPSLDGNGFVPTSQLGNLGSAAFRSSTSFDAAGAADAVRALIPSNNNQLANGAGYVTSAQATAAAPVQTVAGKSGAVTLTASDVVGLAASATTDTTNSGNITFTPTRGVARTAQSKANDIVSVKDFGAVGNGSTDDTAAINSAVSSLSSAGGGTLYFPQGTYLTSAGITLPSSVCVNLVGDGPSSSWIKATGSMTALISKDNVSNPIGCEISKLGLDGNLLAVHVMQLQRGKGWKIHNFRARKVANGSSSVISLGEFVTPGFAGFYELRMYDGFIETLYTDYPTISNQPATGIQTGNTATDSHYNNLVITNTSTASVDDSLGGNNTWNNVHIYGYPQTYAPAYGFLFGSGTVGTNLYSDSPMTAGFKFTANNASLTGSRCYWLSPGVSGSYCMEVASGIDNLTIVGNEASGMTGVNNLVKYDRTYPGANTIVLGNSPNYDFSLNPKNNADLDLNIKIDSGLAATQRTKLIFADRFTSQWSIYKGNNNNFRLYDETTGGYLLEAVHGGMLAINSQSSGPIRFNSYGSSGTGGVQFWSGGTTPTQVAAISSSGSLSATGAGIANNADSELDVTLTSGSTATQAAKLLFSDRGTNQWSLFRTNSNSLRVSDETNSNIFLEALRSSTLALNSQGTGAVRINSYTNSGTGGISFYSGGATPTQVGYVTSAGNAVFNGTIAWGGGSALTSSSNVALNGAGMTPTSVAINSDPAMTHTPDMAITLGTVTPTSVGTSSFQFTPRAAVTLTRLEWNLTTQAAGCTTSPVITAMVAGSASSLTSAVSNATWNAYTDGTVAVAANQQVTIKVTTAGAGCTTNPSAASITLHYRMQ